MGLLANLEIRTKVLVALLPLAIMVMIAALYSSDRMSMIDAHYSALLDKDVKALHNLTLAQSHNNKFGLYLYKEVAELDPDRMRMIDREIEPETLKRAIGDFDYERALRCVPGIADRLSLTLE